MQIEEQRNISKCKKEANVKSQREEKRILKEKEKQLKGTEIMRGR